MNESNGVIVDNIEFDTLEDVFKAIKDGILKVDLIPGKTLSADQYREESPNNQYEAFIEHLSPKDRDDYEMEKASLLNKHNKQLDELYSKYNNYAILSDEEKKIYKAKRKIAKYIDQKNYEAVIKELYFITTDEELQRLFRKVLYT